MYIDLKQLRLPIAVFIICAVVFSIFSFCIPSTSYALEGNVRLPILMYHHLSETESKLNKYTISPEEFEADLKYIKENGYTTVTVSNLIAFCEQGKALPEKPIMITFDDGYESVYKYAYPILCKYEMTAVINIIGKYTDLYSTVSDHNVNYSHITWEELYEMQQYGIEIQNHTYDLHSNTSRYGIQKKSSESDVAYENMLYEDLNNVQTRCKENRITVPTAFAYPFGKISKEALPIIKKIGIKAVFCCWERVNILTGESEELYHLNRFNRPHNTSAEKLLKIAEAQ